MRPKQKKPDAHIGKLIGDFRILEKLGQGGMGVVYKASQVSLSGKTVALKMLAPAFAGLPEAIDEFAKEWASTAVLHHVNVIPILARGEVDGVPFYVMEYVEGCTFQNLVDEITTRGTDAIAEMTPEGPAGGAEGPEANRKDGLTPDEFADSPTLEDKTPPEDGAAAEMTPEERAESPTFVETTTRHLLEHRAEAASEEEASMADTGLPREYFT